MEKAYTQEFWKALSAFQSDCENVTKSAVNPHFRSRYADLPTILDAVRPLLKKHGLAIVQIPSLDGNTVSVNTLVTHESGGYISGVTSAIIAKTDPQAVGSAITYLRRYSIAPICFIAGDEDDDDGEGAADRNKQQPVRPSAKPKPKPSDNEPIALGAEKFDNAMADGYLTDMLNASSMDELQQIWKAMPKQYQTHLAHVKEQAKQILAGTS